MNYLSPGISIILPSFNGAKFLLRVLNSLSAQTLDYKLFEVLVVLNGPEDGSREIIHRFQGQNPGITIRVLQSPTAGASRARNIGLSSVTKDFVTFLDVDDEIEPKFLSEAFEIVDENTCALMPIVDVEQDRRNRENALNLRIAPYAGETHLIRSLSWSLGFNACKILPTWVVRNLRYMEDLQSGEDVVFFANLLALPDLRVSVPANRENNSYVRHIRSDSVSRQLESFDFNVIQRLQCISGIRSVGVEPAATKARESLVGAQFSFIQNYLKEQPHRVEDAVRTAKVLGLSDLNFSEARRESASRLVISYCFPPYADTSANVIAKQIAEDAVLVDVISADMSRVRKMDESTNLIAPEYIVHHQVEKVDASFTSWPLISSFGRKALKTATVRHLCELPYQTMYSRALWSGSHVAAALVKDRFPKIFWEAEFSDPLRKGVDGKKREGKITRGRVTKTLRRVISRSGWTKIDIDTHFDLVEAVTFLLADRLIFTNDFQRKVMLDEYPRSFQDFVMQKSIVRPHASPKQELFELGQPHQILDTRKINIGYFGNFYENRGIGPVLSSMEQLPNELRERFVLHVFCNNPNEINVFKKTKLLESEVYAHQYLNYIDFLATLNEFSVLLVTDVDIRGSNFAVNPFLPSKYSDYLASAAPIWAIVSDGSTLDNRSVRFKSRQEEKSSITEAFYRMSEELG